KAEEAGSAAGLPSPPTRPTSGVTGREFNCSSLLTLGSKERRANPVDFHLFSCLFDLVDCVQHVSQRYGVTRTSRQFTEQALEPEACITQIVSAQSPACQP